jgi:ribonuclease J
MLNLTRPKFIIPVHGEFRMLVQHGRLAAEVGVDPENILILENGQPIEFLADGSARRGERVEAGQVYVDGVSVGEVGDIVLRDRRALAKDGMFLVVVTVDKQNGALVAAPEVVTQGFVAKVDDRLLAGAVERIKRSVETPGDHLAETGLLKAQIKDGLSSYLYEQTRRRPIVFPVVVEV